MSAVRALLCDLDDTFYLSAAGERAGVAAVCEAVARAVDRAPEQVEEAYRSARRAVKARLDDRGCSHARLLYLHELAHALGRPDTLGRVRAWERLFWKAYLDAVTLRPRLVPFLRAAREQEIAVAVVSDLTLEVQLLKLERFGLLPLLDAVVVSEEVPRDKPERAIFDLAMHRLGVSAGECMMIGDNDDKDGRGAEALAIPYVRIAPDDLDGAGFDALATSLGFGS